MEKWLAEKIDAEMKEENARKELRKQQEREAEESKLFRLFTEKNGDVFQAKLVDYKLQLVHFERKTASGTEPYKIPMAQLSKPDVKWIQDELKKRKEAAKKESEKAAK